LPEEIHGVIVKVALSLVPLVAEMVTAVVVVTAFVVIVKVALVLPAATVTLAGTVATEVKLLDSVTIIPFVGAGPESVTVPVEGEIPVTVAGFRIRVLTVGAVTVNPAVWVVPLLAVIVTEVFVATEFVATVKVAVVALPGTVTLAGTCAAAVLLLDSVTTVPLAGEGPFNVTVPVEEVAPMTEVGLRVIELSVAAVTVKVPDFVAP
jgi:hypothetical protein